MFANRIIGGWKIPAVAFYIVAVIFIFAYGAYRRKSGTKDFLENKIIDHEALPGFDGWWLTHALFFAVLGFIWQGHYLQVLVVSLGWEAFEHMLGAYKIKMSGIRLQLMGATDKDGNPIACTDDDDNYWYGRYLTDSYANILGYCIGTAVGRKLWPDTQ